MIEPKGMIEPNDSLGVIVRAGLVGWTSGLTGWVNVHVDWLGGRLTAVRLCSELVTRTCYHFYAAVVNGLKTKKAGPPSDLITRTCYHFFMGEVNPFVCKK